MFAEAPGRHCAGRYGMGQVHTEAVVPRELPPRDVGNNTVGCFVFVYANAETDQINERCIGRKRRVNRVHVPDAFNLRFSI